MNRAEDHLPFLDGIRGIAILAVFLFHALGIAFGMDQLPWKGLVRDFHASGSFLLLYPLSYGFVGVASFFVVSGFCIHLSHQRNREQGWGGFFHRRFFRIYPPYLLAIGLFFFVPPWGSFTVDSFPRVAQLVSHVFAFHNVDQRTISGINPSFWSIAVELQLYAIYPWLIYLTNRLGWRKGLMIVGGIELLIRTASAVHGSFSDHALPGFITASPFAHWLSWSLGAYLAECYLKGKESRLFSSRFEIVAVVSVLLPLFKPTAPYTFLAFAWLTSIALDRLIRGKWSAPGLKSGLSQTLWSHLSFLGVVSYGFYLLHQPLLGLTNRALHAVFPEHSVHSLVRYAICMGWYPLILLLSVLFWKYVEQPSIRLGRWVWERAKAPCKPIGSTSDPIDAQSLNSRI